MWEAALRAARQTLSPPFRAVLLKSLGLTILLLIAGWFGLEWLAGKLLTLPNETANTVARILIGLGAAFGMLFLVAPITAAVAGFFLDDVADLVERTHYPGEPPGEPLPLMRGLWLSLRFGLLVLGLNLLMLPLLFVPVVNLFAWLGVNGYLLSREYFSLAAMRFRPEDEAHALRRRNRGRVIGAGLVVAGVAALPFVNLLAPLFATAFFVHLHKKISERERKLLAREGAPGRLGP